MSKIRVNFSIDPCVQEISPWQLEWVESVLKIALDLLSHEGPVEITIAVVTDETMKECYKTFKGIEKTTNVLAFPMTSEGESWYRDPQGAVILGDIVLSFSEIEREAKAIEVPLKQHVTHLIVHGFLHLFHYDHESDSEAEIMECLESKIMREAGWADPHEVRSL